MHCEQFERRLNQLLDQRRNLAQDATLDRHARQCPRCRRLLEDQQIILAAVHWRRQTPPASRTAVRHPALPRAPHPEKTTPWLMAMIAIGLAVVLASGWMATVQRPQQLANTPVPVADTSHPRASIPWGTARAALSQPEGNGAIQATLQPPLDSQSEPWPPWRNLDLRRILPEAEVSDLTRNQWLDRVRQVGRSIEPLTHSVSSTFSILKRTWPGNRARVTASADQAAFPADSGSTGRDRLA